MAFRSRPAADSLSGQEPTIGSFTETVREQTAAYARNRQQDVVRAVTDVADAIRDNGKGLKGAPHVKAFFDNAADGISELAEDINRRTLSELYDEVEAAVRRRPAISFAAAALAGYALVHLMRDARPRPIPRPRALVPVNSSPAAGVMVRP